MVNTESQFGRGGLNLKAPTQTGGNLESVRLHIREGGSTFLKFLCVYCVEGTYSFRLL